MNLSIYLYIGVAVRVCEAFPGRPPQWRVPNLRECSSPEFDSLKDQVKIITLSYISMVLSSSVGSINCICYSFSKRYFCALIFKEDTGESLEANKLLYLYWIALYIIFKSISSEGLARTIS